jgi:hypothetical protein
MKGKKPTADQAARHQELRDAGALVFVSDSVNAFVRKWHAVFEPGVPFR